MTKFVFFSMKKKPPPKMFYFFEKKKRKKWDHHIGRILWGIDFSHPRSDLVTHLGARTQLDFFSLFFTNARISIYHVST